MSRISQDKMHEIINEHIFQLPEEERDNAYDDILYLYNKEMKKIESKSFLQAEYQQQISESDRMDNILLYEKIFRDLVEKFIQFRLLAITPHPIAKNAQISDYARDKRKTINDLSSNGNTKVIPKTEKQIKMFSKIFENSIFSVLSQRQKRRFIDCLRPKETRENEIIIRKGEDDSKLFFLEKGKFCLLLEENEQKTDSSSLAEKRPTRKIIFENKNMLEIELPLHTVTGEIALLHGIPRTATIISRMPGLIWYLKRSVYYTIRLFDEEQKWLSFVDKMEKKGWTKSFLSGNAQGQVLDPYTSIRLVRCPECNKFYENCCQFFSQCNNYPTEPTHVFFSSLPAQISIGNKIQSIKSCELISQNFISLSEMEGFIVPKQAK